MIDEKREQIIEWARWLPTQADADMVDEILRAYDAQARIIHNLEGDVTILEEEKAVLREQIQIASDVIQRLQGQVDMWKISRCGETG